MITAGDRSLAEKLRQGASGRRQGFGVPRVSAPTGSLRCWVLGCWVLGVWALGGLTLGGWAADHVAADQIDRPTIVVVTGAAGAAEYEPVFRQSAERWQTAAASANVPCLRLGDDRSDDSADDLTDRQRLQQVLAEQADQDSGPRSPLWIVLIGHGTYDGKIAKFNLRGPDVSADDLRQWLEEVSRPVTVINCASSSAPFINRLSGEDRVIVTATKSGFEMNYARFGERLSMALTDPDGDLDKDGQVSLLEAFLLASARVREFYEQESRLATETALIDDNGDGRGTPATWFQGIHADRRAKEGATADGVRAHQLCLLPDRSERERSAAWLERRDQLELEIARLRQAKRTLPDEDAYYATLEPLLLDLARLYQQPEPSESQPESD